MFHLHNRLLYNNDSKQTTITHENTEASHEQNVAETNQMQNNTYSIISFM